MTTPKGMVGSELLTIIRTWLLQLTRFKSAAKVHPSQHELAGNIMAYVDQAKKQKIAAALKTALKGYNIKWSLRVDNHSTLVCTISKGNVDFIGSYVRMSKSRYDHDITGTKIDNLQVNHYHLGTNFDGIALEILQKIKDCMNIDNFDNSDPMTDYFHVGHWVNINVGRWDKPYELIA